jgi:drug/metabolite transporter (DMT)-like permease
VTARAAAATGNLKGILLMLGGVAFLMMSDAVSKYLAESFPMGQVLCLRQVASLLFLLPYAWHTAKPGDLRPRNLPLQLARGFAYIVSGAFVLWALRLLPLATVTMITFAGPLFVAALSAPMLGERVAPRLWVAIAIGFAGVVIIVRPGTAEFHWALLIPVGAALGAAIRDLLSRLLARTDTSIAILFWSSAVLIVGTAFTAFFGWAPLDLRGALLFLLAGAVNFAAHFLMIEAFRLGRAAVIAPFKYSALLWSTLIGYLVWGDLPAGWIWLGAAVLVASGIWIAGQQHKPA